MKNLFHILAILTALSLATFVYGAEAKKEEAHDKEKACCGQNGSCDHGKAEKAKAEKEAHK